MTAGKCKSRTVWELTDHACRHCMGRVLHGESDAASVHRCAECGETAQGEHDSLCYCGVIVKGHGAVFECYPNPNISATTPQEVLVRERRPK